MISSLVLERPGSWRSIGLMLILAVLVIPHLLILRPAIVDSSNLTVGWTFIRAIGNSVAIAACAGAAGLAVGLLCGTALALYRFTGRELLISLSALPLLVPPFLWAIGWSSLLATAGTFVSSWLVALLMCALVFAATTVIPIVLLTAYAATAALTSSQLDAVRLAGGERQVLRQAIRGASTPAFFVATFAAIATIADPGPGQVFGVRTAAADILTSQAALYDISLAGRQCMLLVALILAALSPLILLGAPSFAHELLVRQTRQANPSKQAWAGSLIRAVVILVVALATILPLMGLAVPASGMAFESAVVDAWLTAWTSILYAGGSATMAMLIGFAAAVCIGRNARMRAAWLAVALALFCIPPSAPALGIVDLATRAPAWADPLLRSRFTVCLALGLRCAPIFSIVALRAWAATAPSWTQAAALHGMSLRRYTVRILAPLLAPAAGVGLLLVALLSLGDVTTVLLVHPPGHSSLPLTIFTIMANAPERQVAALCLLYVMIAAAGLTSVVMLMRGSFAR